MFFFQNEDFRNRRLHLASTWQYNPIKVEDILFQGGEIIIGMAS